MLRKDNNLVYTVSKQCSRIMGCRLTDAQNIELIKHLRCIDINDYYDHDESDVITALAETMTNNIESSKKSKDYQESLSTLRKQKILNRQHMDDNISIHDYLNDSLKSDYNDQINRNIDRYISKNDKPVYFQTTDEDKKKTQQVVRSKTALNIDAIFDINDIYKVQRIINPSSLYKYMYIMLDTSNVVGAVSTDTKFKWDFIPNTNLQPGAVNAVGNIRDLVGMRIFPIYTKLLSTPTIDWSVYSPTAGIGTGISDIPQWNSGIINLNNNFTVFIHEFSAQSYIGKERRKFHFVLFPILQNPEIDTTYGRKNWTPLDPEYEMTTSGKGNGWFWFDKPITSISTLTISIANPFEEVQVANTTRALIPLEMIYLSSSNDDDY